MIAGMRVFDKDDQELLKILFNETGFAQKNAWKVFLERYSKLFLKIVWQFEKDYDEVMQKYVYICSRIAQDDFSILRKYQPNDFPESPLLSTYLTVVVRNLCIEQYRKTKRERENQKKTISINVVTSKISDELVSRNGIIPALDEKIVLNKLTNHERKLFRLRFEELRTAKEIAEELGIPIRRVYYNLEKLNKTLKEITKV